MEKIFKVPVGQTGGSTNEALTTGSVQLRNRHLIISADAAQNAFGDEVQVYLVYYPKGEMLLLAPMSDQDFKKVHDCGLTMLKIKNLAGDRSLSLEEIIIDHELDASDRPLTANGAPGLKMLQIILA
ncbi:MAG: hypothetical protein AAF433_21155 [Bacteroidota bacterium]